MRFWSVYCLCTYELFGIVSGPNTNVYASWPPPHCLSLFSLFFLRFTFQSAFFQRNEALTDQFLGFLHVATVNYHTAHPKYAQPTRVLRFSPRPTARAPLPPIVQIQNHTPYILRVACRHGQMPRPRVVRCWVIFSCAAHAGANYRDNFMIISLVHA